MRAFCFTSGSPETPYVRGEADGRAGKPAPAFPTPNSSWADRLYNRGWEAGITKRAIAAAMECPLHEVQP